MPCGSDSIYDARNDALHVRVHYRVWLVVSETCDGASGVVTDAGQGKKLIDIAR
jgi:hypothetical protein